MRPRLRSSASLLTLALLGAGVVVPAVTAAGVVAPPAVTWVACPEVEPGVECATVPVPLDRARPHGACTASAARAWTTPSTTT